MLIHIIRYVLFYYILLNLFFFILLTGNHSDIFLNDMLC